MIIHEFGGKNEKTLLFFPGSCEPWQKFAYAARELSAWYHVLLVTPDGHDPEEGTAFISVEKTVDDTVRWLKTHGIDRLDALYGLSFGGGMAVRFLTIQDIPVEKVIIDAGTAPYQLPRWVCKLVSRDLKSCNAEDKYLSELEEKIDDVEKKAIGAELGQAVFIVSAQLILNG